MVDVLITGGAGFIGSNLTRRLLGRGEAVTVYDRLSSRGARRNLDWLAAGPGADRLALVEADLRDRAALERAAAGVQRIYHLAGQVAVTTSIRDPRADFVDNALGTLNVLEAARQAGDNPIVIYSSTNKVYGDLEQVAIVEGPTRHQYADLPFGVSERQPLDFHSPYGCSKGAGDQYVRDYHRIYGLRTVVFRQSCIYGPRQFGGEDQGWLAWFMIAALTGRPITIFGDGKQVRDVLYIDDLLDVYDAAVNRIERAAGQIYNVGGGPDNSLSIWAELGPRLEQLLGRAIPVTRADWRPGDQQIYLSDIRKAEQELGWRPRAGLAEGLRRLLDWLREQPELAGIGTQA